MKPYTYSDRFTYADVAFEAEGNTLEALFQNSGDAVAEVIVDSLDQVRDLETRTVQFRSTSEDRSHAYEELLYDLLQSIIYWKDVDLLILRVKSIYLQDVIPEKTIQLTAELKGERIDPKRHHLGTDVKAVTYHRLKVYREGSLWKSHVILDI